MTTMPPVRVGLTAARRPGLLHGPNRMRGAMTLVKSGKAELILAAALELFERQGYDATAVPEIAEAAGVGTGTIYRYFATKEELFNALYRRWKSVYNDSVLADFPPGLSIRDRFGAYWRRMIGFAQANPQAARFLELHHHTPLLDEENREISRRYLDVATRFIAEGVAAGELKQLPSPLAVALLWGALMALVKLDYILPLDEATIAGAEACLWDAIRKH